jgi:hypothetical protein
MSSGSKSMQTKSKLVIARKGQGVIANGHSFFCDDENILQLDSGNGCIT